MAVCAKRLWRQLLYATINSANWNLQRGETNDGAYAQEYCHWEDRNFYPYPIASEYKGFFEALVCEDGFDEAMFDEDLLNEENWFVRENGNSKGISCPAIYDNCQIGFRYR